MGQYASLRRSIIVDVPYQHSLYLTGHYAHCYACARVCRDDFCHMLGQPSPRHAALHVSVDESSMYGAPRRQVVHGEHRCMQPPRVRTHPCCFGGKKILFHSAHKRLHSIINDAITWEQRRTLYPLPWLGQSSARCVRLHSMTTTGLIPMS